MDLSAETADRKNLKVVRVEKDFQPCCAWPQIQGIIITIIITTIIVVIVNVVIIFISVDDNGIRRMGAMVHEDRELSPN